jgi:hypothetical protein
MAVARTLQSLQIYDILANLLPGLMLLVVLGGTVRVEKYIGSMPSGLLVAAFIVTGFILGHMIQSVASQLNGPPRLFGLLIAEMRSVEPYDPNGTFEFLPQHVREWAGFERAELSDLTQTEVEEQFWPMAKSQFNLSDDFGDHGHLMRLVLSYLETVSATRALRFQSIHTFHRSMWGMWFLSLLLVIIVGIGSSMSLIASRSPTLLVLFGVGSLLGIQVFGNRKEKFNRKFVEYAIIDFYTQQNG